MLLGAKKILGYIFYTCYILDYRWFPEESSDWPDVTVWPLADNKEATKQSCIELNLSEDKRSLTKTMK